MTSTDFAASASRMINSLSGVGAFVAVANAGSFARAADVLGIARPSVSKSVLRLEKHLGVLLLRRTTRSVSLTAEGAAFLEICMSSVQALQSAAVSLRDSPAHPRGPVRISATTGFGRRFIAPLLHDFQASHPDVEIDFRLEDHEVDFARESVDVVIRSGRLAPREMVAREIAPMQMITCAAPRYLQRHGVPGEPRALLQHRCIGRRLASGRLYQWEFLHEGVLQRLDLPCSLSFNDAELVVSAAREGMGIAQLPAYAAMDALRSGALRVLLPETVPEGRSHYLCFQQRRLLAPRIRAFITHVLGHAASIAAGITLSRQALVQLSKA